MPRLLLALLLTLNACECGFKPVSECEGSACDAGASGGGTGGGTAGGSGGSTGGGGPATCAGDCIGPVSWGYNGGFVAFVDTSSIPCLSYQRSRDDFRTQPPKPLTCENALARCPTRLAQLLADPLIKSALAAKMLYGTDSRPVDGSVFRITARGGQIEIGDCTPDCRPPQVKELEDLLHAIDVEQLALEPCKSTFP